MSAVPLPAGDIDNNGVIDQFDAMTIGMNYNASSPSAADLNNSFGKGPIFHEKAPDDFPSSGAFFVYLGTENLDNNPSSVSCGSSICPPCNLTNEETMKRSIVESISNLFADFVPRLWTRTFRASSESLAKSETVPSVT